MTSQELRDLIHNATGMDTSILSDDKAVVQMAKTLQKNGTLPEDLEFPAPPREVKLTSYKPKGCDEELLYAEVPSVTFTTPGGQKRTGGRTFVPVATIDQLVSDLLAVKAQADGESE